MQNSRKLSAHEFLSTVKSRKFSLAKIKCYTVMDAGNKIDLLFIRVLNTDPPIFTQSGPLLWYVGP